MFLLLNNACTVYFHIVYTITTVNFQAVAMGPPTNLHIRLLPVK